MAEAFIVRRGGGGGSGGALVVTSSGAGTVTVSNSALGKSYSKSVIAGGSVVFKGLKTGTWTVQLSNGAQTSTKTVTITSDYSTSIAYFSATISITYPANSTCVVTNSSGQTVESDTNTGSSTKTWTATVNATGTYTVTATATDGSGKSKSQNVSITADGQSKSVTLSYEVFLFNNGAVVPFSSETQSEATVSIGNKISFGSGSGSSLYNRGAVAYTKSKIDLTEYTSVVFEGSFTKVIKNSKASSIAGVITQKPSAEQMQDNLYAAKAYLDVTNSSWTVDISRLSGEYYVSVSAGYSDGGNLIGSITRIYLA